MATVNSKKSRFASELLGIDPIIAGRQQEKEQTPQGQQQVVPGQVQNNSQVVGQPQEMISIPVDQVNQANVSQTPTQISTEKTIESPGIETVASTDNGDDVQNGTLSPQTSISQSTQQTNPIVKAASGVEVPDLYQIIQEYDKIVAENKANRDRTRNIAPLAALQDIGFMVGDFIGAGNNARVDKRERGSMGTLNDRVDRLDELYRNTRDRKPQLLMDVLMRDYQNKLGLQQYQDNLYLKMTANELAREKEANGKAINEAKLALQKNKNDADAAYKLRMAEANEAKIKEAGRHNKAMEGIGWKNAETNRTRVNNYTRNYTYNGGNTPKGFFDFVDPNTGKVYRVPEKKWKTNYTKMFDAIKPVLEKDRTLALKIARGDLKPQDKEELLKQYMYDNTSSLDFLETLSDSVFDGDAVDGFGRKEYESTYQDMHPNRDNLNWDEDDTEINWD